MKTSLLHRGLYLESLRRLRLAGILLTAIPTAIMLPMYLTSLVTAYRDYYEGYTVYSDGYDTFVEIYPLLVVLPFVVPVILSAVLFSQQNKRCDSDFYHSLPLTKRQLSVTWAAAVATWSAVVVLGSSLTLFAVDIINIETEIPTWDAVVLPFGGALVASLMVTAVLYLAYAISGNAVSALFAAALMLFAPHLIVLALSAPIAQKIAVVSVEVLNWFQYFLLYTNYNSPLAWVVTGVVTAVCFLLALWASGRRQSEIAGQAAVSKALQIAFRLTAAFVVCLPAIIFMCNGVSYDNVYIALFYVLALAVYFLFELFTTKKAKNMLKAIPWLGVLAALNIAAVGGIYLSVYAINSFQPEPDEIDSVSVTKLIGLRDKEANDECIPDYQFPMYQVLYEKSDCPDAKLTDDSSKSVVSKALQQTIKNSSSYGSGYYDSYYYAYGAIRGVQEYQIEVKIDTGFMTRTRLIWVNDAQLKILLRAVDAEESLPVNEYLHNFSPNLE